MKFADLHLHTVFSDGTYTPKQLIQESINAGLSSIAVVDHDTVDGLEPALKSAQNQDLEVLPGVELTAEYQGREIHILGYLIDFKNRALIDALNTLQKNRKLRIYKMVNKLSKMGLKLQAKSVFDISQDSTVGRLHVARAMVKQGLVGSIQEAFRKYIGDKCQGYVLGFRLSPQEAVKLIKQAGGIPVLAHPCTISKNELIPRLIECGIMGLEVYYPGYAQPTVDYYLKMAKEYNLLVTGGSDYHGDVKPEVKLGCIKIPYDLVESLREAKNKL